MKRLNQFLTERHGRWYYQRRVPEKYACVEQRRRIRTALNTSSVEIARTRRTALAEADNIYWEALLASVSQGNSDKRLMAIEEAMARYRSARKLAMARGFVFTTAQDLVASAPVREIIQRLQHVGGPERPDIREAEAVLGTVAPAALPLSKALDLYISTIAASTLLNKSEAQKRNWAKPKRRAVANFIEQVGDLPMDQITRHHAKAFHTWWGTRLTPKEGTRALNSDSANRDIGNLRTLFREYWEYEGEENRPNPFRKLRFKEVVYKDIPPFSSDWVRSKILLPKAFGRINREAELIVYAMIETGCRPSEIANLLPEQIVLDHEVPHIQIKMRKDRKLKSAAAVRDIPLVGVSLAAFQRAPTGFEHYRDRGNLLSASLMRAFRARELFETEDTRIYSFRHSFEKRMLEAGIDYGLRCLLMGHKNSRPSYGDGGSLAYRRTELEKIAHPLSTAFSKHLSSV